MASTRSIIRQADSSVKSDPSIKKPKKAISEKKDVYTQITKLLSYYHTIPEQRRLEIVKSLDMVHNLRNLNLSVLVAAIVYCEGHRNNELIEPNAQELRDDRYIAQITTHIERTKEAYASESLIIKTTLIRYIILISPLWSNR